MKVPRLKLLKPGKFMFSLIWLNQLVFECVMLQTREQKTCVNPYAVFCIVICKSCQSSLARATSTRYWFKCWPNIFVENDSVTCRRASTPILCAICGSRMSLDIAKENSLGLLSQRNPVTPFLTVSTGPPLLHAITGLWAAIASSGTMPKCSSCNG